MSSLLLLLILTFLTTIFTQQSIPLFPHLDGYSLGSYNAPIHFSCWIDLMCSDSLNSWSYIKQMINYYNTTSSINNKMYFTIHFLPLPYHYNAYYTAQSINILNYMYPGNTDIIYKWIDIVFENQPSFYNEVTANMTSTQIIASFGALAEKYLDINAEKFINNYTWDTYVIIFNIFISL